MPLYGVLLLLLIPNTRIDVVMATSEDKSWQALGLPA